MKVNKNDYVVVNGKKYYATGGNTESPYQETDPYGKLGTWGRIDDVGKSAFVSPKEASIKAGHQYYRHLNPAQKQSYLDGRNRISKFMIAKTAYDEGLPIPKNSEELNNIKNIIKEKHGIDLDQWNNDTKLYGGWDSNSKKFTLKGSDVKDNYNDGFNNNNSRAVYKYLSNIGGGMFTPDKDGEVRLGANVIESVGKFDHRNNIALQNQEELDVLKQKGIINDEMSAPGRFSRFTDRDGNKYYSFASKIGNGNNAAGTITVALDKNNNIRKAKINSNNKLEFVGDDDVDGKEYIADWKNKDGLYNRFESNGWKIGGRDDAGIWKNYNTANKDGKNYYTNIPETDFSDFDETKGWANGGQLNRYYADGGAMGQIPLGEQEPEGYNMVGAGGMHEENPMGGVPYGVNQDGSQNMVEQGEVSMGDNVFSDRSQLSPELCQQLGLPEGTTPAQAMQQIEQLYEQGQLSDEEFQEVQQIIFQDQEAQKENMGGSYQQGEVGGPGVPNEGIDPNMGGMPMDPMAMQGGQPEGITPDMIQGQGGFGGY